MPRVLLILLLLTSVACGRQEVRDAPVAVAVTAHADDAAVPAADAEVPEAAAMQAQDAAVGDADVLKVEATQADNGRWTFDVTVRHLDTGWEDYANGWDVVLPDGTVVKRRAGDAFTRPLGHPHVDEQPFTRSQSRLVIPEGVERVTVRAHELKHGYGGITVEVDLPRRSQ